jgi:type I restriction enzyme, S subunit
VSFPRYPRYRDSGVEWLGDVPEHWAAGRLGSECDTVVPMRDKPSDLGGDTPWIRIEDFDGKYILESKSQQGVSRETIESMGLKVFPVGTVLCSCSCSMGATAIVAQPLVTNQTFIGVVPRTAAYTSEYLFYLFQAAHDHLNSLGTGAIQRYLSRDDFRALRLPKPPVDEQVCVARFLDREVDKVDELVVEQQRLIELLKEKRQAVISHAVTKGLNPDAAMKPSGVDWLGDVPTHWDVKRLRHVSAEITVGIVVEPSKYYVEVGVPALRSLNIRPGAVTVENLVFISAAANEQLSKSKLRTGDLVAVRSGQPGTTAVIPAELDGCNCIDLIIIRRPRVGSERFLCWFLGSDAASIQFSQGSGGAIQQHFNVGTAMDLVVSLPPAEEQVAIAVYLERSTSILDAMVDGAERAITLLQERRAALISAAVTGKIDVRGLVDVDAA